MEVSARYVGRRRLNLQSGYYMPIFRFLTLVLLFFIVMAGTVTGQQGPVFNFSGSLGLQFDAYRFSETNYAAFRPRHPENLGRFSADATLSAGRHFVMPFSIHITTGQNTYNLPTRPDERFIDYIQNPRNNVYFNPQYKWAQAFLGTQTPLYSSLTTGDIAMFGAGIELTPGDFLFTLNYGKSQTGVEYDPFNNVAGAYEQRLLATRIGYGRQDGTRVVLHFVKSADDAGSIDNLPPGVRPAEGITVSPLLQLRLSPSVLLRTETAASVQTNDLLGPDAPYNNPVLDLMSGLMQINASSNADWSNETSLDVTFDLFSIGGEVRYIGAGFRPAGYRLMERDLIDYSVKSEAKLLDNRLLLNGQFGLRTSNLSEAAAEKNNRTIVNLNVFSQITEAFSVNTSFANFGFRNNVSLDTLRVEMISNTFSVAPTWQIRSESLTHVVAGSFNYSRFDDFNLFTGSFQNTVSFSVNGNYQIAFSTMPLSLGVTGMYLENSTPVTDIRILNAGFNARYRLLDRRLVPSLLFSWTGINRDQFTADNRFRLNLKADYRIAPRTDLRAGWNLSSYRYGTSRPDAGILENRFQVSIQTRF